MTPVQINNIDHGDLRVRPTAGAAFGDAANQALVFPAEFEELQREFAIIFRRRETGLQAYALLGQIFLQQKRLDDARREFEAQLRQNPRSVGAGTMVAQILYMQRKSKEAQKAYSDVLTIDPKAAVAANNLAWIYAEEGSNLDEALRLAQLAVQTTPDEAAAHDTLGWVYYKRDLAPLAVRAFQQAVEIDGKNAEYHYRLALAHAKSGDAESAKNSLRDALRLNPNLSEAAALLKSVGGQP